MSKPSFSNIDLWLFELAEGNLSKEQIAQLEMFLMQHPELDVDRDVWEMAKVDSRPVSYPDQEKLHKRKPIGAYSLVGASFFVLLTFVGCYNYFSDNSGKVIKGEDQKFAMFAAKAEHDREKAELRSEIRDLKTLISAMESERKISRSNGARILPVDNSGNQSQLIESGSNQELTIISENPFVAENTNQSIVNSIQNDQSSGENRNELEDIATVSEQQSATELTVNESLAIESLYDLSLEPVTKEVMEIGITPESEGQTTRVSLNERSSFTTFSGMTFKNKLARLGRSIQRMMDNPVALKNSRDPHYHVPGMLSQDINFGSTGTLIAPRFQTLSRMQWYNASNELFKNQIAIDGYSYAVRGGIGIQLNHSFYNRGGIQVSDAAITYSPKISVSRTISVEPAVRFKMGSKVLNNTLMADQEQVEIDRGNVHDYYTDGLEPIGRNLWYKDLGLGVNVNTKWFFASIQADNIFRYRDNIYSLDLENPRRAGTDFLVTIGTDWESKNEMLSSDKIVSKMSFSPYLVYHKNEALSELWIGGNYRWAWFTIGGAISTNLDPAASIGLKFKHFSIHYNADYAMSVMNNERSLSHQVSLRFLGKPGRQGQRLLNL